MLGEFVSSLVQRPFLSLRLPGSVAMLCLMSGALSSSQGTSLPGPAGNDSPSVGQVEGTPPMAQKAAVGPRTCSASARLRSLRRLPAPLAPNAARHKGRGPGSDPPATTTEGPLANQSFWGLGFLVGWVWSLDPPGSCKRVPVPEWMGYMSVRGNDWSAASSSLTSPETLKRYKATPVRGQSPWPWRAGVSRCAPAGPSATHCRLACLARAAGVSMRSILGKYRSNRYQRKDCTK